VVNRALKPQLTKHRRNSET